MSWRTLPIKRVAEIRVSNVDKKSREDQTPVRLCNYTDVYYRDTITPDQVFMIASATREQVETFGLRREDVVITKDSETPDDIGVPAFVAESAPDLVCGYHLAVLRPRPAAIDGRYLHWSMNSIWLRRQLAARATGVTRFGLRTDVIGNAQLCVPPLDEQRRIADFLDDEIARLDELAVRKKHLLALLDERRRAVVRSGVSGEIVGSERWADADLPWLERMPAGWRIAKLTHVARLGTGHTPDRRRSDFWVDCTIPWITTSDIEQFRDDRRETIEATRERISERGLANSSAVLHPAGTVVLSRTASIGFSAIMGRDMATSQDFVTWTCSPDLDPRFLLLCLRAMRADLVGRLAMGSTHQTIYMPDVEALRIPLPPIVEQRSIVAACSREIEKIDDLTRTIKLQLPLLQERRTALITASVTGQLDPSSYRRSAVAA
jgi:type I restriction enzyme S subunit